MIAGRGRGIFGLIIGVFAAGRLREQSILLAR
jgi:hypothetical protein